MDVYQRISDELKERKNFILKEEESVNKGFVKAEIISLAPERKMSFDFIASASVYENEIMDEVKPLLKRKHSMAIEVEIPSFFNDKRRKSEVKVTPEKKKEDGDDKPTFKKCYSGKFANYNYFILIDFGKGLFDEKLDFDHSDEMENFKVVKKQNFDFELREIEIKSAIFNTIPEDMFFSLD